MSWENIEDRLWRARVPRIGWLVMYVEDVHVHLHEDQDPRKGYEWNSSVTFVPDPHGTWEI
jgi:hypothetical protein